MRKILKYLLNPKLFYRNLLIKIRLTHYRALSNVKRVSGKPISYQPILMEGKGSIEFGDKVRFGVTNATEFYSGYVFLNPRTEKSNIKFGSNIWINNNFTAISEGEGIYIGDNTIVGTRVTIMDTDFHHLDPNKRLLPGYPTGSVKVGNNVWIGNNVTILKNSEIGDNSIIATGAVVTGKFPPNVVIGGIPSKVIKEL